MANIKHKKLNQFFATAICGNDILSSALYVSGIACVYAGVYAPIVLAVIALVLFFYKSVYTEVVETLPINGGAYNCLLNGTSKTVAAIAGVITVLSYIATAVISANVAIEYIQTVIPLPIIAATIGLLLLFACLVIMGIRDSAKVAFAIFAIHVLVLTVFVVWGGLYSLEHHGYLAINLQKSTSLYDLKGLLTTIFFGFSASLLGVSGFESSANFVEEQDKGVFRKTLRNMLIGVAIFNPLIALVSLNLTPLPTIISAKDFLLADEAYVLGGYLFQMIMALDAFLVLAGAVLTAYVGVTGLVYRMSSDACLPDFLTVKNGKGAYPVITVLFFFLCTSILLITKGDLLTLAGVYTIAFLSVMTLFALGNLILRQTRTELKRPYTAPGVFVVLALLSTLVGIIGNLTLDPYNFEYFVIYFIPAVIVVLLIVYQDSNAVLLMKLTEKINWFHKYISHHFQDMIDGTVVAFINHSDRLYEVLEYINHNETARNVILVHCKNHDNKSDWDRHNEIKELLPYLRKAGVFPHLNISLVYENKPFGPDAIKDVSMKLKVRHNRIMIGSIHHFHQFDYSDLGGVRIIF